MKKLIFALPVAIFGLLLISCNQQKDVLSFEAMNTFMTVQSFGKNAKKTNLQVQERIKQIENSISTTQENSYINKLNHNQGIPLSTDDDTFKIVSYGLEIADETQGALNIALYPIIKAWGFTTGEYKIPSADEIQTLLANTDFSKIALKENNTIELPLNMQIDLGALGKGFAGDEAITLMKKNGISSALLNLGGNVQALGTKPDGSEWTIGIKNPADGSVAAALKIKNQTVITSGGYERYFTGKDGKDYIHIFDGKTGSPVENEISSVSIICDSGIYADALSTSIFVMGLEKAELFWKSHHNFEMIIITKDEKLIYTNGLKEKISVRGNFKEIHILS